MRTKKELESAKGKTGAISPHDGIDKAMENKSFAKQYMDIVNGGGNPYKALKRMRKKEKRKAGQTLTQRLNDFQKTQNILKANGY